MNRKMEPDNETESMKRGVRIMKEVTEYGRLQRWNEETNAVTNITKKSAIHTNTHLVGTQQCLIARNVKLLWRVLEAMEIDALSSGMIHASLPTGHIFSQFGIKQQKVLHAYRALSTVSCILELVTTLDAAVTA